MSTETDALARVRRRIQEACRSVGLIERSSMFAPSAKEGGSCEVQVWVTLDPDFDKPEVERDPEFEKVIADAAKAEADEKRRQAEESLTDLKDKLKKKGSEGIL